MRNIIEILLLPAILILFYDYRGIRLSKNNNILKEASIFDAINKTNHA